VIGDEAIGALVVEGIGTSPAILLRQHGVFTIGPTATDAVKAAVMVEDIAATVWAAMQIGDPEPLSDDIVARLHRRYTTDYGQPSVVQAGASDV
jgi:ribulose-5-phosphate 4-epimerase/fuculose-1-phosphate aldolase